MDDAVLEVAAARFAATGGGTVLFNFRGVGSSEGRHDGGAGEVDDVLAVAAWLARDHATAALTLIGYSFGSSVAWRALPKLDRGTHAVLIAPPFGAMAYPASPDAKGAVIVGDQDPLVDTEALARWLACHAGIRHIALAGADHFLATRGDDLAHALDEVVALL